MLRSLLPFIALLCVALPSAAQTDENAAANILPPLSLTDARWLTERAQTRLESQGDEVDPEAVSLARLMLQCVIDYVQLVEQRRSSLTQYSFVYMGKGRLTEPDTSQVFTLELDDPSDETQALAFDSTRETVLVEEVTVTDENGTSQTLTPGLMLDPLVPGRSFVYLQEASDVESVTVRARAQTWDEGRPRVKVWLGSTEQPEILRHALTFLTSARQAVDDRAFDRAIADLEQARRRLAEAIEDEEESE